MGVMYDYIKTKGTKHLTSRELLIKQLDKWKMEASDEPISLLYQAQTGQTHPPDHQVDK